MISCCHPIITSRHSYSSTSLVLMDEILNLLAGIVGGILDVMAGLLRIWVDTAGVG